MMFRILVTICRVKASTAAGAGVLAYDSRRYGSPWRAREFGTSRTFGREGIAPAGNFFVSA